MPIDVNSETRPAMPSLSLLACASISQPHNGIMQPLMLVGLVVNVSGEGLLGRSRLSVSEYIPRKYQLYLSR